jgi:hypothetical protein
MNCSLTGSETVHMLNIILSNSSFKALHPSILRKALAGPMYLSVVPKKEAIIVLALVDKA